MREPRQHVERECARRMHDEHDLAEHPGVADGADHGAQVGEQAAATVPVLAVIGVTPTSRPGGRMSSSAGAASNTPTRSSARVAHPAPSAAR